MKHQIYLIPGFFGFASIGGISYFRQVRETLEEAFESHGHEVEIIGVRTLPTASLTHRARRLVLTVMDNGGLEEGVHVHLVGHSTGALDARLAACNEVRLDLDKYIPALHENLRTVVSISGPHYGSPLANFFTTLYGKNLLYLVSLLVIVGLWRRPITLLGGVMSLLGKVNDILGLDETLIYQVTNDPAERRALLIDSGYISPAQAFPGFPGAAWRESAQQNRRIADAIYLRNGITPIRSN